MCLLRVNSCRVALQMALLTAPPLPHHIPPGCQPWGRALANQVVSDMQTEPPAMSVNHSDIRKLDAPMTPHVTVSVDAASLIINRLSPLLSCRPLPMFPEGKRLPRWVLRSWESARPTRFLAVSLTWNLTPVKPFIGRGSGQGQGQGQGLGPRPVQSGATLRQLRDRRITNTNCFQTQGKHHPPLTKSLGSGKDSCMTFKSSQI